MKSTIFYLRNFLFLCGGTWILSAIPASGEQLKRVDSGTFPVSVEAQDHDTAVHLLTEVEHAIHGVFDQLQISFDDIPFSIRYIWEPGSGGTHANEEVFPRMLHIGQQPEVLKIYGWGKLPEEKEILYRTTVLALLQGYIYKDVKLHAHMVMKDPPLWISEGLTQVVLKADLDTFDKITHRYQTLQRAPLLQDMEQWADLGRYHLQHVWRQAFCSRLFEATMETESGRQELLLWMRQKGALNDAVYWGTNAESAAWWSGKLNEVPRPDFPILDYDETLVALENALVFKVAKPGKGGATEMDMRKLPTDGKKLDAADCDPAEARLVQVQSEASFLIQPLVMQYHDAYECWKVGDFKGYQKKLDQAAATKADLLGKMQAVQDRLDWYEMNFPPDTYHVDMDWLKEIYEYQMPHEIPERDAVAAKLTSVEEGQ